MPATSMRSVTTPASFFIGTARDDDDDDDGFTLPSAPETTTASSPVGDFRSALLIYSEETSRRTGVGCFARAMMTVMCSVRGRLCCGSRLCDATLERPLTREEEREGRQRDMIKGPLRIGSSKDKAVWKELAGQSIGECWSRKSHGKNNYGGSCP